MSDNTLLNPGAGGDTVRDLARQAGSVKTQVVQLDLGGASANAEKLITAGQQVMANAVPVVIASDQTAIATQGIQANNNWGQALSVVAASTIVIASVAAPAGYRVKGMVCNGTGDGYFALKVASATILSGRIRAMASMLIVTLPNGVAVGAGVSVTLSVTNESSVTADYEATLLGE